MLYRVKCKFAGVKKMKKSRVGKASLNELLEILQGNDDSTQLISLNVKPESKNFFILLFKKIFFIRCSQCGEEKLSITYTSVSKYPGEKFCDIKCGREFAGV